MSDRRKGKVARLTKELRDVVNLMLLDGTTYVQIVIELEKRGEAGFNAQNICNWHGGGYVDWLKQHERLEQMRLQRDAAIDLVKDNQGSTVTEAALHLASAQAYEVLADFDLSAFKEAMTENPAIYPKLINGLSKISKEVLGYERFREQVKAKLSEVKAQVASGGLTAETIERIERELKLL